jgi:3-oxoacyl-[acyl-carrier protein] reductase
MNDFKQVKSVMLITGTSRGIGNYLANYYIGKGFVVIGCSRNECEIKNENYIHIIADLSNESEVINVIRIIRKKFKRLDILINNAAINPVILNVAFLPYKIIENIYSVNVFATILFCREAIKLMMRNSFGRIINIGSMATRHEVAGEALYTSTKSSINAFTRVLSKEVASSGITVNVVAPSVIETELSKAINKDALKEVLNRNAIKKYGNLIDVSNSIDFLIKEESNSITGQIIYLGGV